MHKILRYNFTDSDNQIFFKGCLTFLNPVPLIENFNSSNIVGFVKIIEKQDGLYADLSNLPRFKGYFPAIGFKQTKIKIDLGVSTTYGEIFGIGICTTPNTDPEIKPI